MNTPSTSAACAREGLEGGPGRWRIWGGARYPWRLLTPLTWVEHYPEHEGEIGEYSLVKFTSWELENVCLCGPWRYRIGSPEWSSLEIRELDDQRG
jgi:hypothetical protein